VSKERAQRRAARVAEAQRRQQAEQKRSARRGRWHAVRNRLAPRRGRVGKIAPRYSRSQTKVVVFGVGTMVVLLCFLIESWPVRVALICLALVGLPALLTLTYDRSPR
jgi:hypothetical protein